MEWTQVFVIIGVFAAGYFHLSSKIDNRIDNLVSGNKTDLSNLTTIIRNIDTRLTSMTIDINNRLSQIEAHLQPKVFPIQEEKPKKKAKGE